MCVFSLVFGFVSRSVLRRTVCNIRTEKSFSLSSLALIRGGTHTHTRVQSGMQISRGEINFLKGLAGCRKRDRRRKKDTVMPGVMMRFGVITPRANTKYI